ncbi:hypothetical protein D9M71_629400 [compost metagenome]
MRRQAVVGRLQGQVGPGGAGIEGMAGERGGAVLARCLEAAPGEHEHQGRGIGRPALVEGQQQVEEALPLGIVPVRIEEAPGLGIVGRGRPAGRFEQRVELLRPDRRAGEGTWRPAVDEQRVDGVVGLAMAHWRFSCSGK